MRTNECLRNKQNMINKESEREREQEPANVIPWPQWWLTQIFNECGLSTRPTAVMSLSSYRSPLGLKEKKRKRQGEKREERERERAFYNGISARSYIQYIRELLPRQFSHTISDRTRLVVASIRLLLALLILTLFYRRGAERIRETSISPSL